jgi:predicted outer membrane protein
MTDEYPRYQALTTERAQALLNIPERQALLEQLRHANTLAEIEAAKCAYKEWMSRNPDDFGVLMAAEALSYAQEALTTPEPEGAQSGQTPGREAV